MDIQSARADINQRIDEELVHILHLQTQITELNTLLSEATAMFADALSAVSPSDVTTSRLNMSYDRNDKNRGSVSVQVSFDCGSRIEGIVSKIEGMNRDKRELEVELLDCNRALKHLNHALTQLSYDGQIVRDFVSSIMHGLPARLKKGGE